MNNPNNNGVFIPETLTVSLRNSTFPFASVALGIGITDSLGKVSAQLSGSFASGGYYLVINHKNSIETWSANPLEITGDFLTYDFTTSSSQTFGNNMTLVEGKWSMYGGDVNQDGLIDLTDVLLIYNDAGNFATGNMVTDVNGDNNVDLDDLIIAHNTAVNFVHVMKP